MKAGLVRIASGSLLAIAVTGLSACNDDPLDFNVKTATQLATNPSEMVLEGGRAQRLIVNTLNDGFEPTFDVPSLAEGTAAECTAPVTGDVSFVTLPAATGGGSAVGGPIDSVRATGAQPPDIYDVTGELFGEACLIASFAGLEAEEIPITIVPFVLVLTGPDMIGDGDFATKTYTVEGANFPDSSVNAGWDVNAPYVSVSIDDTLAAFITDVVSPNTIEIVRGPLGGDAVLTVTTDQGGVIRTTELTIAVEQPIPSPSTITPGSGLAGDIVTIDGTQLSVSALGPMTEVTVNGLSVGNVVSESPTQLMVQMPTFSAAGTYDVVVILNGVPQTSLPLQWTQTAGFGPITCSPGCEVPGGAVPISIPYDFTGTIATVDNYFVFTVSRDQTITMNLGWGTGQDVDILVSDGAFTAYVCTDGATGADPETSNCSVTTGTWGLQNNLYGGAAPVTYTNDGSIASFD